MTISLLFKAQLDTSTHWTRPPPTLRPHTRYSALDVKSRRGKHYNRAVRLHKIICEAIARLLVEDFEHSLSGNTIEMLNELKAQLEQLKLNLCQEEIEQILESDVFQQWENRFQEHIADMKQKGNDLAKFGLPTWNFASFY